MPPEAERINLYQMYTANGNRAGFWVKRNSWSWQAAQIISIGGQTDGVLDGKPPYFNNQKVLGRMGGVGREVEILCPGTFGYRQIDAPK